MEKFIKLIILVLSFQVAAIDVQYRWFTQNLTYETLENAILENPQTGVRNRWGFTLGGTYVENPLSRGAKRTYLTPIISELYSLQFGLNLAISKRFELMVNSQIHHAYFDFLRMTDTVMGDTKLGLKYQLLKGDTWAFALMPQVFFTTGNDYKFLGKNTLSYGILGSLEKRFSFMSAVLNVGYGIHPENVAQNINYERLLHIGFGVRIPINKFALHAEYRVSFTNDNTEQRPNEAYAGVSYQLSKPLRLFTSVGLGDSEFKSNSEVRVSAGIKGSFGEVRKRAKLPDPQPLYIPLVHFDLDSYEILPTAQKQLNSLAKVIVFNKAKIQSVELLGHTCTIGPYGYNHELSVERAHAVAAYLYKQGVPKNILAWRGFGKTQLAIDPEMNTADREFNRRVRIKITFKRK